MGWCCHAAALSIQEVGNGREGSDGRGEGGEGREDRDGGKGGDGRGRWVRADTRMCVDV